MLQRLFAGHGFIALLGVSLVCSDIAEIGEGEDVTGNNGCPKIEIVVI
uniref:Uncharacterized protein n=1 Tax=Arundo donax TaxID=35708 RepID=A0A0A9BZ73_ARUDO